MSSHGGSTMSLPNVPAHLTIRVLHSGDDIIVIEKPCDLRSVPGHANPPPSEKDRPKSDSNSGGRRTAQEAWVKAIQLVGANESENEETRTADKNVGGAPIHDDKIPNHNDNVNTEEVAAKELLSKLGTTANPSCVPRKLETFVKYCHRNSKRLLPSFPELHNDRTSKAASKREDCVPIEKKQKCDKPKEQSGGKGNILSEMRIIAQISYARIQQQQRPLINLPKPTEDWESAIGQLRLLGFGDVAGGAIGRSRNMINSGDDSKLHVVHRLDCQTSGIMVVARNQAAASTLSQAWRERTLVQKVYLAHVAKWPPYHDQQISEGTINIPLAPSQTERIKWEVCPVEKGGKECKTYWKVYEDLDEANGNDKEEKSQNSQNDKKGITLELHPITGRTHQLRLHCAATGSGIIGDSLYGDSPIKWSGDHNTHTKPTMETAVSKTLRLHAHRLTLPNPRTGENITFESPKPW